MAAITAKQDLRSAVVRRLAQIQSSNHELIELLGVIHFKLGEFEFPTREADAQERLLHLEFRHLQRFKSYVRGAEWFNPSDELYARINAVAARPDSLGLPRTVSSVASVDDGQG